MTEKKELKRRVRARMRATGEVYTTALAAVRAGASPPARARASLIDVLKDLGDPAGRAGIVCPAEVSQRRWTELGAHEPADAFFERALTHLRGLVLALEGAPGASVMRAAILEGLAPPPASLTKWVAFLTRVRAGYRGVDATGHLAAVDVRDGAGAPRLVLFSLWPRRDSALRLNLQVDPHLDSPFGLPS